MPALSRILSSAVERLLFHPVTIADVEVVGESFRLLRMQGVGFQGVTWIPGQTVQIFLGNFIKRAYTRMSFDSDAGSADFLVIYTARALALNGQHPQEPGTSAK